MTDTQVVGMAKEMAGVFGVKIDDRNVLSRMGSHRSAKPVVVCDPRVTIWIGKECVKLREHDDIDITYIYVTKQGAEDELRVMQERLGSAGSQNEFIILTGITRQLRRALAYMEASGSEYYLFNWEMPW